MAYSSTTQKFLTGARPVVRHRRRRTKASEVFPELEPAETTSSGATSLRTDIAQLRGQFRELVANPESRNPLARAIVYALNAVLLVVAFPVGVALLLLNLLIGENLRTTTQIVALTGVAIALSNTEVGARILGLG